MVKKIQFVFLKQTHSQDAKSVPIEFHSFKINKSLRQFSLNISGQLWNASTGLSFPPTNFWCSKNFKSSINFFLSERNQMILELENGVNLKSFLVLGGGVSKCEGCVCKGGGAIGAEMRKCSQTQRDLLWGCRLTSSLLLAFYTVVPDVSQQFGFYIPLFLFLSLNEKKKKYRPSS